MERLFGARDAVDRPAAMVPADWAPELERMDAAQTAAPEVVARLKVALGAEVIDAGTAIDAETLADRAPVAGADAIAVSAHKGVGLGYARALQSALAGRGTQIATLIERKLNEAPADTNSGAPVGVTEEIRATGVLPCADLDDMLTALATLAPRRAAR